MQKSSLVVLFILMCSLLAAVFPAVEGYHNYSYEWGTFENAISFNWYNDNVPEGYSVANIEFNRNGFAEPMLLDYWGSAYYTDSDITIGNTYNYSSRFVYTNNSDNSTEYSEWSYVTIDTSELEDLLDAPTNLQLGAGTDWEGNKTIILSWDYTAPEGYWPDGFVVKRSDQDWFQEVYNMDPPFMFEDMDFTMGETYTYYVKARMMGEMNGDMIVSNPTATFTVDTNSLPLSNIQFNGMMSGTYNDLEAISLFTPDTGASIYYTLDGSEPTTDDILYTDPIVIPWGSEVSLKARAFKTGATESALLTLVYTLTGIVSDYYPEENKQGVNPEYPVFAWYKLASASGYYINVGTTSGNNDILANHFVDATDMSNYDGSYLREGVELDLDYETQYFWSITAQQTGTATTADSDERSFTTAAEVIVSSYPYQESFETSTINQLAEGWTDINLASYQTWKVYNSSASHGNNSVQLYTYSQNDWLFSSELAFSEGREYEIQFSHKGSSASLDAYLVDSRALDTPENPTIVQHLGHISTTNWWDTSAYNYTSLEDGNYFLAFKPTNNNGTYLYLDNIIINEAIANIPAPIVEYDDEAWHDNPFTLELNHEIEGAQLYYYVAPEWQNPYDFNASFASDRSLYEGPVQIEEPGSSMLYLQAEHPNWLASEIINIDLNIKPLLPAPMFDTEPGNYNNPIDVELISEAPAADTYYTTDGSDPFTSPTKVLYTEGDQIHIDMNETITIKAASVQENYMPSEILEGTFTTVPKLVQVTFSPEGGLFTSAQSIELNHIDAGTTIYYTLDGSAPDNTSLGYTTPLQLAEHTVTTISAIAYKDGFEESDVSSQTYTITGQVDSPTTNVAEGIYSSPQSVSLSTTTESASIRYTVDGTDPDETSTLWTGLPIEIGEFTTSTIKAIAYKENWAASEMMTITIQVTGQLPQVEFSLEGGAYESNQILSLSVPGYPTASIYSTSNGSEPSEASILYIGSILLNAPSDVTIKAIAVLDNYRTSEVASNDYEVRYKVETPVFSQESGIYTAPLDLEITSATNGASVYYTTDGSDPTTGMLYSEPIQLEEDTNTEIRAIAMRNGWFDSELASVNIQVTGTVPTPTIDTPSGVYVSATTVTVTNTMAQADVYYTLDGSEPTTDDNLYVEPLTFNPGDNDTLKVKAFREDWLPSTTVTRFYSVPDETMIYSFNMVNTTLTTEDNPSYSYSLVTNHTTANVNARITILDSDDNPVVVDEEVVTIFGEITNQFFREIDVEPNLAEGNYTYKLDILNTDDDILDTFEPTSPFQVGTPAYTITGNVDHDFGTLAAGSTNTHSFTLNSTGSIPLNMSYVPLSEPFSSNMLITVLGTGNSWEYTITFQPETYGTYFDQLVINTNAGAITCNFSGEAVMGQYRDNISEISATVDYGQTTQKQFVIYNDSPAADLNVSLSEAVDWLSLDQVTALVPDQDSLVVNATLGLATLVGGTYTTDITITTDDLRAETVTIPVTLTVNGAVISTSHDEIEVITGVGEDVFFKFRISNDGSEPLAYSLDEDADWLIPESDNGNIEANGNEDNELEFDGDIPVGTYTTTITIESNDINTPELTIPVTFIVQDAVFGFLPLDGILDFGNVAMGSSRSLPVTLKNTGNLALTVNSLVSASPAFTFDPEINDLELAGGTEQEVDVIFTPAATAFYNDVTLTITYEDEETAELSMFGRGEDPNPSFSIDWVDNRYDFGNVEVGSTEINDIRVYNNGNVELHFNNFVYEDEDITEFELEEFTLDVGKDHHFDVSFAPILAGEYELDIQMNTTEGATQTAVIEAIAFDNSNTAQLTYPEDEPFNGEMGVNPIEGLEGTNFEFRVVYTDLDNLPPRDGSPVLHLDLNHDGDTDDDGDQVIIMTEVDEADLVYTDGKLYECVFLVPFGYNPQYRMAALDNGFKVAEGQATHWLNGPVVANQGLDLGLYASHIEFSEYHPNAGQEVIVVAHIQNWGDLSADNVPVTFLLDEVQFDQLIIPHIEGNSEYTLETTVSSNVDGFLPVKVHVNRNNANPALIEANQLNNFASRPLVVGDVDVPGSIDVTATASPATVYESSYNTFSVYGRADYVDVHDPNLDVSGSFVRAELLQTGEVQTTHTNSWGNYSVRFNTPANIGVYDIEVYVTDYTLEGQETTQMEVIARPDRKDIRVYVSTVGSQYPRVNPPTADTFDIYVQVMNIGSVNVADDIDVDLNEGRSGLGGINLDNWTILGGLDAGESQTFTFEHPGVANIGWYYFHGAATHASMHTEDNTSNNYHNGSKYIYPALPDLTPTYVYFYNLPNYRNHGVVGSPFNGKVQVSNKYVTPSIQTTATVEYRGPFTGNVWAPFSNIVVPALGAFDSENIDFGRDINIPVGFAGFYDFKIIVDPVNPGIVAEHSELNNEIIKTIEVKNPDWDFFVNYNSIEISNYDPAFAVDQVNFTADISNNGTDEANNVQVKFEYIRFQDGVEIGPWQQIGDIKVIPNIGAYDTFEDVTSDLWLVPNSDGYKLRVTVDPFDNFVELNENNNDQERWLGYDFYPWAHSDYYYVTVGEEGSVGRYISSRASWQADDVPVVFYDWFPHEPFTPGVNPQQIGLEDVNIPGNNGTTYSRATKVWNQVGLHKITCHVDITDGERAAWNINPNPLAANGFTGLYTNEIYEDNNVDYLYMDVQEPLPDLVAWSEFINPTILNPDRNEAVDIQSSFENHGVGDVDEEFKIKFYIDSVQLGNEVVVAGIDSNENGAVQATEQFSSNVAGAHVIRVELDTDGVVGETNEDNNLASRVIVVGPAPNMVFGEELRNGRVGSGLSLSDSSPEAGQEIIITANITNNGRAEGSAWVDFYYVIAQDSTLIASRQFTVINGETEEISVDWIAESEFGSVVAVIRDATPIEFNALDNTAEVEFGPSLQFVGTYDNVHIDEDAGAQSIGDLDSIVENRDNTGVIFFASTDVEGATVTIDENNVLWLNPPTNYHGTITVDVEAVNLYNDSRSLEINIDVDNVNDLPVMTLPESFTVTAGDSLAVDFLPFLVDVDDAEVSLNLTVEENNNVVVSIRGLEVDFIPNGDFEGIETIYFAVTDDNSAVEVTDSVLVVIADDNNSLEDADQVDYLILDRDRFLTNGDVDFYTFQGTSDLAYFEVKTENEDALELSIYLSNQEDGSDIDLDFPDYQATNSSNIEVEVPAQGYWFIRVQNDPLARTGNNDGRYTIRIKSLVSPKNVQQEKVGDDNQLTWDEVTAARSYKIYRKDARNAEWGQPYAIVNTNSFLDEDSDYNYVTASHRKTLYLYRIVASTDPIGMPRMLNKNSVNEMDTNNISNMK